MAGVHDLLRADASQVGQKQGTHRGRRSVCSAPLGAGSLAGVVVGECLPRLCIILVRILDGFLRKLTFPDQPLPAVVCYVGAAVLSLLAVQNFFLLGHYQSASYVALVYFLCSIHSNVLFRCTRIRLRGELILAAPPPSSRRVQSWPERQAATAAWAGCWARHSTHCPCKQSPGCF